MWCTPPLFAWLFSVPPQSSNKDPPNVLQPLTQSSSNCKSYSATKSQDPARSCMVSTSNVPCQINHAWWHVLWAAAVCQECSGGIRRSICSYSRSHVIDRCLIRLFWLRLCSPFPSTTELIKQQQLLFSHMLVSIISTPLQLNPGEYFSITFRARRARCTIPSIGCSSSATSIYHCYDDEFIHGVIF